MKNKFVLIALLLFANGFTLLAQTKPKTKTTTKQKVKAATDTTKAKSTTPTTQNQVKKFTTQTRKVDSVAVLKVSKTKPDTTAALSAKVKKAKPKSQRQLRKEAEKNDINNWTEQAVGKIGFKGFSKDSTGNANVMAITKRASISLTNARTVALTEPGIENIKFFHRYWRDIDLADPKNRKFATYHADLITALLKGIKDKELKAYNPAAVGPENPNGDSFTTPIRYDDLMSGLSETAVVNIVDKDGNVTGTKSVANPFSPEKISGYRIKEDVYYDRIRSRTIVRIVGIAPLVKLTLSSGEVVSVQPLCWLRFKDCRKILITMDIDPTQKVGDSMDDVFIQRRFYGKIVQESNPEGKRIKDYKTEVPEQDAEARRMEDKVIVFKKGSWNYSMAFESPVASQTANIKPTAKRKKL